MKTVIVAEPEDYPVSVEEVKTHMRFEETAEDTYIEKLIGTATSHIEAICSRKFITQTHKLLIDEWPGSGEIKLPFGKIQSVTSVAYKDENEASSIYASENYTVDTDLIPGRVVIKHGKSWPSTTLFNVNPISVTFVCGYGDSDDVPGPLRDAIILLVAHWHKNREPVIAERSVTVINLPYAIDALIWNYRTF